MLQPYHQTISRVLLAAALASVAARVVAAELEQSVTAPPPASSPGSGVVTFEMEVQPLLTRFGCNSGACHGKSRGQNGFALSLLGFDANFDYDALVHEGRGRRLFPAAAEHSLLLRKASGQLPHGGGKRFDVDSPQYRLLQAWIERGAPRTPSEAAKLVQVVAEPASQSLAPQASFPLRVVAIYSDGSRRDVTDAAAYQSNDRAIAAASADGLIQSGPLPGEATIMARYMNHIAVCHVMIPLTPAVSDQVYESLPRRGEIDRLVWEKLKRLGMLPSATANEATIHRRAFLRAIGRLPQPAETRAYLADNRPDKFQRLVEELLERPEYADFWANKWADLLRPNPYRTGIKAVWNLDAWLRSAFRQNMPYDQFVRELVTAHGSTWRNGATVIFRDRPEPAEIGASVSQLFLGVRLECAKCHHHPFEVWSQDDFFGFAAFFARTAHKGEGLSPPISGGEEILFTRPAGQLLHGRTGVEVKPKTLTGQPLVIGPETDPRAVLIDWMTDPANPMFAKVMANRVWAEVMGQGLVDPVDDLRATNPASNEALLQYLADDFRRQNFDIKKLIQNIMTSEVFRLSSSPGERNHSDLRNFSRYYRQRMRAEVLLDSINDVLGVEEEFPALPPGSRATQLWTHRAASVFLDTFGRPDANQDPPCERTYDSTTPQILHLMNSAQLNRKLALETARPAQLASSEMTNLELVDETYLLCYGRLPSAAERFEALQSLPERTERRRAVEDLFWVLLNTPEFSFID